MRQNHSKPECCIQRGARFCLPVMKSKLAPTPMLRGMPVSRWWAQIQRSCLGQPRHTSNRRAPLARILAHSASLSHSMTAPIGGESMPTTRSPG